MSCSDCPKEETSQSSFSPGTVQSHEDIAFALIEPDTFQKGLISLSRTRLKKEGVSVCRANLCTASYAQEKVLAEQFTRDSSRQDHGVAWLACKEIRDIKLLEAKTNNPTDTRGFCVVDDAYENYQEHAHVQFANHPETWMQNARNAAFGTLYLKLRNAPRASWNDGPFKK